MNKLGGVPEDDGMGIITLGRCSYKGQASKPSEVRIFQQIRIQSGHKKSSLELTSQTFHRAFIDSGFTR